MAAFSDPRVIEILQRDFIPVAGNTAYLAPDEGRGRNWCESSRFLEGIIQKSGLRKHDKSGTAQGYYAFSASGDFYGGFNDNNVKTHIDALEKARKAVTAKPPAKVELKETTLGPESAVPEGASVLRVFSRIDPLPEGLDARRMKLNSSVGRDHLWILKSDLETICQRLSATEEADAPESLSKRLVRFHLIDNVRGEPDMWGPEHVKARSFQITKVTETPALLTVKLTGSFTMQMPNVKVEGEKKTTDMGLTGTLEGVLEIDRAAMKLKSARIFASGEGYGASTYTPFAPPGKFPLKIAMVVVDDTVSRQVAPEGVMYVGREAYLAPTCK